MENLFNFIEWELEDGSMVLYSVSTDWMEDINAYETAVKVRYKGELVINWIALEYSLNQFSAEIAQLHWVEYIRSQHPTCFYHAINRTIHAFIVD